MTLHSLFFYLKESIKFYEVQMPWKIFFLKLFFIIIHNKNILLINRYGSPLLTITLMWLTLMQGTWYNY